MSILTASLLNHCSHFAHALLPPHCVLCGATTQRELLCDACAVALPRLPQTRCAVCALPLTSGNLCGECVQQAPAYDSVSAVYTYTFPVDMLIQAYKYHGQLALAPLLARHLAQELHTRPDALIPLPLADRRLRERGFNQAQELARHLGRRLRLPVLRAACRKVTETLPQAALAWADRTTNVRNAFVCDENLEGQHIAVIDDVMTTGATMSEIARVLKRAGARRVEGWVIARTPR